MAPHLVWVVAMGNCSTILAAKSRTMTCRSQRDSACSRNIGKLLVFTVPDGALQLEQLAYMWASLFRPTEFERDIELQSGA